MTSSRALIYLFAATLLVPACGGGDSNPSSPSGSSTAPPFAAIDLTVGTGAEATPGRSVTVNYQLWLYSATAPENKGNAVESGTFPFTINGGGVITGFNQAVTGMRVGGRRRAIIPPNLAYGSTARNGIPANSTLVFDIELVNVQ
jgi:FKBP-type peptidyl-prolyl cis-trans isomerase FkpA